MKNISIIVENKKATVVGQPVITCGNSDHTVTFAFDSDWSLTGPKTARFVYVKRGEVMHEDVVFEGNTVAVPVLSDVAFVNVGVFAGDLSTTTPARVACRASILCGSGAPHDPTPDVYNQIMTLFNSMAEKGTFGATEAQAQQIEQNRRDIAALEGGTKEAGKAKEAANAEKLGGHIAEYFFPRSGGTVNGNLKVSTSEDTYRVFTLKNGTREIEFAVYAGGAFRVMDITNNKLILLSNAEGKTTFEGTASGNLPLTGGEVTGTFKAKTSSEYPLRAENTNARSSYTAYYGTDGGWLGALGFNTSTPSYRDTSGGTHELLHTGNMADHVLPIDGGGTVKTAYIAPIALENTNSDVSLTAYKGKGVLLGYLGMSALNKPCFQMADGTRKDLLHTGNSAKVHIGTSAPSDTSSAWFDTSEL